MRGNVHHEWTQGRNKIKCPTLAHAFHESKRFVGHGCHILMHLLALKTWHDNGPLFKVFLELSEEIKAFMEHFDEERIALAD